MKGGPYFSGLHVNIQKYLQVGKRDIKSFPILTGDAKFSRIVDTAIKYIKACDIKELPLYVNHPNKAIRRIVVQRLQGGK